MLPRWLDDAAVSDDDVVVERTAAPASSYVVLLRRIDGSMTQVASGLPVLRAEEVARNLRRALGDGEPWALRLRDVSAGELRSS